MKLAEKGALQATHEVSVAHSAWTRARNTRGEGNAKVQETRETATVQEDQFPMVTKAVDAFPSLVRDELVAEKCTSASKEETFEDSAQAVVDEILKARSAKPSFNVEESEPPAAKKRKTKNGVDYLKIVNRLEKARVDDVIEVPAALAEVARQPRRHHKNRRRGRKPKREVTVVYWNGNKWTDEGEKFMRALGADMWFYGETHLRMDGLLALQSRMAIYDWGMVASPAVPSTSSLTGTLGGVAGAFKKHLASVPMNTDVRNQGLEISKATDIVGRGLSLRGGDIIFAGGY